tara:strand:+ start:1517 stop:1987 length:471 start_codon:yes stop_codon:yes gene_type:complete
MVTDKNHAPPITICNDKMAVLVAPRSGSTSLEKMLGKNIISLEEYKNTKLKRVVIIRDPFERFQSVKRIEELSAQKLPEEWWIPDFLQQIEDIQQDYILFEKYEQYNSLRAGMSVKDKKDLTEAEIYNLFNEDYAYGSIIQNNNELSVEEWHDLCN